MCDEPEKKTYYAIAIDPIHVGAGTARLERVDLPIVRDPATGLPKIPGTSLSGPARMYTAMKTKRYQCAGSGGVGGERHCGEVKPACPVCVPYGFSKGAGYSLRGLAQFFDAHILFFPVISMIGTVWVTAPMALEGLGLEGKFKVEKNKFYPLGEQVKDVGKLNFGWLMLSRDDNGKGSLNDIKDEGFKSIPEIIKQRAVLVSTKLFPEIVNTNLEIRKSISINPETGTAEEGALFTYEAIPRGTVFKFDIVYNSGKYLKVGNKELKTEDNSDVTPSWVKAQVEKGLKFFEILGIGGMNTRGMGRLKVLNLEGGD